MELKTLLEAINSLLSSSGRSSVEGEGIHHRLESNLVAYRILLRNSKYYELSSIVRDVKSAFDIPRGGENPTLILYNQFVVEALALVSALDNLLLSLNEEDKLTSRKADHGRPPPAPSALLSVAEHKTICSVLEFIVFLGLYPYLLPGLDNILRLRLTNVKSLTKATNLPLETRAQYLSIVCSVIVKCFKNEVIGRDLLSRHLSEVLTAMIQICYAPDQQSHTSGREKVAIHQCVTSPGDIGPMELRFKGMSIRESCAELLQGVLRNTYQPLIVKELLFLQRMSSVGFEDKMLSSLSVTCISYNLKWLQKVCGHLLSERLMSKSGVQHVISGIMEATADMSPDKSFDWRKCKAVAKIIATCPSQVSSMEEYYSLVCPQVLELMHTTSRSYFRIAVETISKMMTHNEMLSEIYLFKPLVKSLFYLFEGPHTLAIENAAEIEKCVHYLHKICMTVEPCSKFLTFLFPLLPLFFGLWRAGLTKIKLSDCCKDIVERVLKNVTSDEIVNFLFFICNIPCTTRYNFKTMDAKFHFSCVDNPLRLNITYLLQVQNLDIMENVGHYVIKLLQSNFKSCEIIGIFFMECMRCLELIIIGSTKFEHNVELKSKLFDSSLNSSALLECEKNLPKSNSEILSNTAVLYTIASLCEHLCEEVLHHVHLPSLLETCKTILKCHAKVLDDGCTKTLVLSERLYEDEFLCGPTTLNIVFGMLSAILSGAREVDREYRHLLTSMMQSLSTISDKYPDLELCKLAGDISVCIGTLGAVWSTEMKECAASFKSGENQVYKNQNTKAKVFPINTSSSRNIKADDGISKLQASLQDLKDPMIPVRGQALMTLSKLVEVKDPEAMSNVSTLLEVFKENLCHSDSFVYLAAIKGMVSLALSTSSVTQHVTETLCQEYASLSGRPNPKAQLKYDQETGVLRDKNSMKIKEVSLETRMKLGEALMRVFQELQDNMLPQYLNDIVASLLTTVRDPDPILRASSLSNIAEICGSGKFNLTTIITEVLSCVKHILKSKDEDRVRQAAVLVLKHIIKGSQSIPMLEFGDVYLDIYRLLKLVEDVDHNELTRAHAQAALGELDTIMRTFIFPQQKKMEKKIVIS